MHLVFIVQRAPQADEELPASSWTPPLCLRPSLSLFDLSVLLPSHLFACAHTHKPKPPDRKYGLGSQRGFLIQTSPVEQPEVAAPTPLPLVLSFQPPPPVFLSASVDFSRLPPHVLATRAHTDTPRLHTSAFPPTSFKRFRAAHQSFL